MFITHVIHTSLDINWNNELLIIILCRVVQELGKLLFQHYTIQIGCG